MCGFRVRAWEVRERCVGRGCEDGWINVFVSLGDGGWVGWKNEVVVCV